MQWRLTCKFVCCIIVLAAFKSFGQSASVDSCNQFHRGRFTIEGKDHITIKRKARRQIERDTKNKTKSKYKIRWTDNCSYTLTLTRSTDKDRIMQDKVGAQQPHIITNTNGTRYTYSSEFSFWSADVCGTLKRFEKKEETLIRID